MAFDGLNFRNSHGEPRVNPLSRGDKEKSFVALTSVVAAVFLTGGKLAVGLVTGSLGILSEAAHSALDLVAAVVTLFAVRASGKPADREHTYGHGKIENLSALFETILLLVTCVWIIYEAIDRLFFHEVDVDANVWSFLVILASIVIDISRSRALMKAAVKYRSQALEADALHFSTDVWSSSVVLFGLGMVYLAHILETPWLIKADSVAALIVAGIVVWVSIRLGKRTLNDLLDTVPANLVEDVTQAAHVPGVDEVRRVRLRRSGPTFFADVTLSVRRDLPLTSAHQIADRAEEAIRATLPEADIVVHVDPAGETHENTVGRIREIAAKHGLSAHAIAVSSVADSGSVEMHLEVDKHLRVAEAHDKVTAFEKELHDTLPTYPMITTHIEPCREDVVSDSAAGANEEKRVTDILKRLARESHLTFQPHELQVRREEGKLVVLFHCACDGETNIAEAHALTVSIENRLRKEMPQIGRVVIHIEPLD
jgi:cation diffusion facilitator family transporter